MSLLQKIFRRKPDSSGNIEPAKLTPRLVRVQVTPLHRIAFRPVGSSEPPIKLANISIRGMALIGEPHLALPKTWLAESLIDGALVVDQKDFIVQARIRHLGEVLAGCEFVGENLEVKRAIESYLRVEILALNLRPVDAAYLKPDPRGTVQWFTDGRQNELFFVCDAEGVVAFNMSFLGTYVEGGRGLAIRSGTVQTQQNTNKHKASELLDFASSPTEQTLKLAEIFINNIESLSPEIRSQLTGNLKSLG